MTEDPYQILGVSPDASDEDIKRAYRRLAKKYHPDLNPGDEEAARQMQKVNAAYEAIVNKDKGGSYHDPFRGAAQQPSEDARYQQAAMQYIRYRRFREALNVLESTSKRDAQWYYLSALAHDGLGEQVLALEHMRRAVSMEPDNLTYIRTLDQMQSGGRAYTQQAEGYDGYPNRVDPCTNMLLCWFLNMCCCGGPGPCC